LWALRCPGELTKDLTLNAKAKDLTFKVKDSKFVLEDISRPKTTTLAVGARLSSSVRSISGQRC